MDGGDRKFAGKAIPETLENFSGQLSKINSTDKISSFKYH
jgi:hypothetical protein